MVRIPFITFPGGTCSEIRGYTGAPFLLILPIRSCDNVAVLFNAERDIGPLLNKALAGGQWLVEGIPPPF
jgi:hypothetical protein